MRLTSILYALQHQENHLQIHEKFRGFLIFYINQQILPSQNSQGIQYCTNS